jgi:aspartyl-tRNA(Asn)/glutamyl-tRNA(Gln) amidotransferase subunit A
MAETLPTIADAARAIRRGQTTPRQWVERCLAQLDRLETKIRAWVSVDARGALEAADRLAREFESGQDRGPLHGIPIGVKDIIDVAGLPTRSGSPLTNSAPVQADAPVVAALREAGAVILGKTVTTEFACFDPPPTHNPWRLDRTPGGSSSGSAAAVATGMCLGAIGSQTGGSITRPASYCGVAGCKPTFGAVSLKGVTPVSGRLDHVGPIARTAGDLELLFNAIRGNASAGELGGAIASPRIGLLAGVFLDQSIAPLVSRLRPLAEQLEAAGAEIGEQPLPASFDEVKTMHFRIMAADAAANHTEQYAKTREAYGQRMTELIEAGRAVSSEQYDEAIAHQVQFRDAMLGRFGTLDALLTLATLDVAPDASTTGDARFNAPWSYSGLPTVSIPCGLSDGLPFALQLIGRPHDEPRLFAVARWLESTIPFRMTPELGEA